MIAKCAPFVLLSALAVNADFDWRDVFINPPSGMDRAVLHLWPCETHFPFNGAVIVVPGMNGDGREAVRDIAWRTFAQTHRLCLVGASFASPPDELRNGRGYYRVADGAGVMLLDCLHSVGCSERPLFLYGFSGGAHFVSDFVQWRPENVHAWCAYSAAWWPSPNVNDRTPPGIVACGAEDFRVAASRDFFEKGRDGGARWLWVELSHVGHKRSERLERFFQDYATVLLSNATFDGNWVNVQTGRFEPSEFAVRHPCAMGWLPDRKLHVDWRGFWRDGR